MPRGGFRSGAGRKPGSVNKDSQLARDLLKENKELLIQRAIALATANKPNIPVLLKLLDKVLPSLSSADIEANIKQNHLTDLSEHELKKLTVNLAKLVVENEQEEEEQTNS